MNSSTILKSVLLLIIVAYSSQSTISDKIIKSYNKLLDSEKIKISDAQNSKTFVDYFTNLKENKIFYFINLIEVTNLRAGSNSGVYTQQIEDLIKYIEEQITPVFIIVRDDAIKYPGFSYSILYEQFASDTHTQISNLVQDVENRVYSMLNEIDYRFILKEDCKNKNVVNIVKEDLRKHINAIPNPWESCREKLEETFPGIRWKLADYLNEEELYATKKCIILKELDKNRHFKDFIVQEEIDAYNKIFNYAGDMRCINMALNSSSTRKVYVLEMIKMYKIITGLEDKKELNFLQ